MVTYKANFRANNGTRYMHPIEDTNKWRLLNRIRESALAERFQGNEASWHVWIDGDEPCDCKIIFEGTYYPGVGIRYSVWNGKHRY